MRISGWADWVVAIENNDTRASGSWRSPASWRSWRTASTTWFHPCMYASESIPPLVFTGSFPPMDACPSSKKPMPTPAGAKPYPSSWHTRWMLDAS